MKMLALAISITAQAFQDKTDRGGKPYILHCLKVMEGVRHLGEDAMCAAVMHDLIEDTEYSLTDIINLKFNQTVCHALACLTHAEGVDYMDYIREISNDPIATEIKKKDLEHNSQVTRLKGLTKKDFNRLEKYCIAYTYLSKV